MTAALFSFAALAVLTLSVMKTSRLFQEFETLNKQIGGLREQFQSTRLRLRKKINRLVVLQKESAGETIPTVTFQKLGKTVNVLFPDDTIYSLAEDEGFGLTGTCEGNGDCALCAISIVSGAENISPMEEEEAAILKQLDRPAGCRLSCQAHVKGDIVVNFLEL
ncbi:MAG: 2Fe-2S iron-sulfur cluster-binding protein [Nitrospinales bacterium]